jgi:hypothetical protein
MQFLVRTTPHIKPEGTDGAQTRKNLLASRPVNPLI